MNSAGSKFIFIHSPQSMNNKYMMNADGDFLFVPQRGLAQIKTELGVIEAQPGEIVRGSTRNEIPSESFE